MSLQIGSLLIEMSANVARLAHDMAQARGTVDKAMGDITRSIDGVQKAFGLLGMGLGTAQLVSWSKSVIDSADNMNDLTQRLGINIRDLATWKLAAQQSGTSMETVAKGVKGLSGYITDHGDQLRQMGVRATDANGALIELADVFAGMPDGVDKVNLAVSLFGKAGMDMIPMLNQGSEGLRKAKENAEAYAERLAVLAPEADRLNDELERMNLAVQTVAMAMASTTAGPMADWLDANLEAVRIAGSVGEALRLFVFNLDAMTTEKPAEEIRRLTKALEEYQSASAVGKFMQSPTGFLFGGREADLSKQLELLKYLQRQQVMADASKLGDYRDTRDRRLTDRVSTYRAPPKPPSGASARGASFDPEGDMEFALAEAQRKSLYESLDAQAKAFDAAEIKRVADEQARLNQLLAATPTAQLEKQREDMMFLADEFERGRISAEQFSEAATARLGLVADRTEQIGSAARDLGMTFSSAFEDAIVGGKKFSEVLKGLEQDIARIIIRKSITEPMGNAISSMVGSFFGGGRATGGSVVPGHYYVVGENGPEVLLPNTAGTVIPNDRLSAGGGTAIHMSISIDARGADQSVVPQLRQAMSQMEERIYRTVPALVSRQQLRNRITPMSA